MLEVLYDIPNPCVCVLSLHRYLRLHRIIRQHIWDSMENASKELAYIAEPFRRVFSLHSAHAHAGLHVIWTEQCRDTLGRPCRGCPVGEAPASWVRLIIHGIPWRVWPQPAKNEMILKHSLCLLIQRSCPLQFVTKGHI